MASSQELKHRTTQDDQSTTTTTGDEKPRKKPTGVSAARGSRSLCLGVGVPLLLTVLDVYFFGSSSRYRTLHKPFYVPPLWAVHLTCVLSSFLTSLSAWLVWAEGGFHRSPNALTTYAAQLVLSLLWYVIVFGAGMVRVGLVLCAGLLAALVGCAQLFKGMNHVAGDLTRLCLAWPVMLALLNVRLFLYH